MKLDPILNQPLVETDRFDLRALRKSDLGMIELYGSDGRVARMTTSIPHPLPPGASEAFVQRAMSEVRAIRAVAAAGIDTLTIAGYGCRGANPARQQSFLVTDELSDTVSLEELGEAWRLDPGPAPFKWALIRRVGHVRVFAALASFISAVLILLPILLPIAQSYGINPVQFGVITALNLSIGLITPPYGILLFVINAVTGISLRDIIAEVLPFLAVLVAALLAMIFFPGIVLFLPRLMGYDG